MDGEDGGEVVEDDTGGEDAEDTAEDGQECVHLHPTALETFWRIVSEINFLAFQNSYPNIP